VFQASLAEVEAILLTNKIHTNVARLLGVNFDADSKQMERMAAHSGFSIALAESPPELNGE
jgi:hypothetical protein